MTPAAPEGAVPAVSMARLLLALIVGQNGLHAAMAGLRMADRHGCHRPLRLAVALAAAGLLIDHGGFGPT